MKLGMYATGLIKAYWTDSSNPAYPKQMVAVIIGEKQNQYGETEEIVQDFEVNRDCPPEFGSLCNQYKDAKTPIALPFRIYERRGTSKKPPYAPYAFVSYACVGVPEKLGANAQVKAA